MRNTKTLALLTLAVLFIVSTISQSIDKPITVTPNQTFAWDDTNNPPCVGYTVFGQSQTTGGVTRTYGTTTNRVSYGTLFGTNHPTGLNAVFVIGWDSNSVASDRSTNYYINWTPAPPRKGKPVRLRTL